MNNVFRWWLTKSLLVYITRRKKVLTFVRVLCKFIAAGECFIKRILEVVFAENPGSDISKEMRCSRQGSWHLRLE